jgi:hypothetical protein
LRKKSSEAASPVSAVGKEQLILRQQVGLLVDVEVVDSRRYPTRTEMTSACLAVDLRITEITKRVRTRERLAQHEWRKQAMADVQDVGLQGLVLLDRVIHEIDVELLVFLEDDSIREDDAARECTAVLERYPVPLARSSVALRVPADW